MNYAHWGIPLVWLSLSCCHHQVIIWDQLTFVLNLCLRILPRYVCRFFLQMKKLRTLMINTGHCVLKRSVPLNLSFSMCICAIECVHTCIYLSRWVGGWVSLTRFEFYAVFVCAHEHGIHACVSRWIFVYVWTCSYVCMHICMCVGEFSHERCSVVIAVPYWRIRLVPVSDPN